MNPNARMYWMQAITPLHVGSGKGVGFIDMPIMREKVTNWPLVPGSAVKGVMRDHFNQKKDDREDDERKIVEDLIRVAFGRPEDDSGNANSGSLIFTDAHIVCLPVRSLYGTFAYVTSPLVLERLKRDLLAAGYKDVPEAPEPGDHETLHTSESELDADNKIFFEDLDFASRPDDDKTQKWAEMLAKAIFSDKQWQRIFKERFAVVSDNSFNFLSETATEVSAHIKIEDDRKIVAKGALWYEEALPVETILAGIAWCDRVYGGNGIDQEKIIKTFCSDSALVLQIGGKATVGKGRVRCLFTKG